MTKPCSVLVTCIGGVYARDTIEALRLDRELQLRIVGCDGDSEPVNRFFVDAFHQVPMATQEPVEFARRTLEICRSEGISVVIPGADEEVLALAAARDTFAAASIVCTVEERGKLDIVRDKVRLFDYLHAANVPVPGYARVSSRETLREAARNLGYPVMPFVLKPSSGRGARGIMLVDASAGALSTAAGTRGHQRGNLESIMAIVEEQSADASLMAMEYLPGPAYDVDCLATCGVPRCVVVRRRLWRDPLSPTSQGCRIERHDELEQLAKAIAAALSFNFLFDLDFGTGPDGGVGLFELNPRWSGAVASALGGGVNLPALLVRSALELPLPEIKVEPGRSMFPITRMAFVGGTDAQPVSGVEEL